jgi:hypothetical protein
VAAKRIDAWLGGGLAQPACSLAADDAGTVDEKKGIE